MSKEEDALSQLIEQYGDKLQDPIWRICSGALYKILIKGNENSADLVIPFVPNRAQRRLISKMHYRNLILKARQKGFTTLVAIIFLDHALWVPNSRCGIVAHDRESAEIIFRDKVKFAYDNLPDALKMWAPLAKDSASELLFSHNNSSFRVATSLRSGTIHRLHISEFGKICAKYPQKAKEVMTGSIPAVPATGIVIVESTAEGDEGDFYDMTQRAMELQEQGKKLSQKDFRFHFFAWWDDSPEYEIDPGSVIITDKDHQYFDRIETEMDCTLTLRQRAWYVATRDSEFNGKEELMWQEYPSTQKEAFQRSTEGCYFAAQMAQVMVQKRICSIPVLQEQVSTFWDLGNSDGCAIWFHQQVGMEDRFIDYYENRGKTLTDYVAVLQNKGYLYGTHYLPHDADHKRLSDTNKSMKDMLVDLGVRNIVVIPRVIDLSAGIQVTRKHFSSAYFDETRCAQGIKRLKNYKKKWDSTQGRYNESLPEKNDGNSEGADAFRQFAQAKEAGLIGRVQTEGLDYGNSTDWF